MNDEPPDTNPETPPPPDPQPAERATPLGSGAGTSSGEANPEASLPTRRISHASAPPPPVKVGVYEGPLDLLLDLIRKQEINIYDIPIATITQQYLEYLHLLKELNIDVASEFVFMAATLIHIKSRMLLPVDPTAPADEQEDPRTELVQRLLEHEQFKNAAEMLNSKRLMEDAMWSQPGISEFSEAADDPGLAVSVFDLISVFREILERAKQRPQIEIRREEVTVAQMMEHVKEALHASPVPVPLEALVGDFLWRQALIALFLAVLELVRLRAVVLRQMDTFAPITIVRGKRFEEILAAKSGEELAAGLDEEVV
jgi:segregation and condensation protein A